MASQLREWMAFWYRENSWKVFLSIGVLAFLGLISTQVPIRNAGVALGIVEYQFSTESDTSNAIPRVRVSLENGKTAVVNIKHRNQFLPGDTICLVVTESIVGRKYYQQAIVEHC